MSRYYFSMHIIITITKLEKTDMAYMILLQSEDINMAFITCVYPDPIYRFRVNTG